MHKQGIMRSYRGPKENGIGRDSHRLANSKGTMTTRSSLTVIRQMWRVLGLEHGSLYQPGPRLKLSHILCNLPFRSVSSRLT
jgi:hypothetical protein